MVRQAKQKGLKSATHRLALKALTSLTALASFTALLSILPCPLPTRLSIPPSGLSATPTELSLLPPAAAQGTVTRSNIATVKTTFVDKSRNKTIEMRVTSPTKPGNYPVIVFSHGAGGSRDNYLGLIDVWAPSGYICLQPTHDDSISLMRRTNPTANIVTALDKTNEHAYWVSRGRDVAAVLDNLDVLAKNLPAGVTMDKQNIGVGGHSYGAFTTLISAGAPVLIPKGVVPGYGGLTSFAQPRAKAFLVLCGQGTGKVGLCFPDKSSYAKITAPMMVMTGSKDFGQRGQQPTWRMESYTGSLHDGNKYLLYINGANHMTFGGNGNRLFKRGSDSNLFGYVQQGSLSFWNAYLKNDATAKQALLDQQLGKNSGGVVKQENH